MFGPPFPRLLTNDERDHVIERMVKKLKDTISYVPVESGATLITTYSVNLGPRPEPDNGCDYFWWYQIGTVVYPFGKRIPTAEQVIQAVGPTTLPEGFKDSFYEPALAAIKRSLAETHHESPDWPYVGFKINPNDDSVHSLNGWRP